MDNFENNQNNLNKNPKKKTLLEVLLSIFGSFFLYFLMIVIGDKYGLSGIIANIVISMLDVFISIKLIRKGYKTSGIIMLSLISPVFMILMLFGGCALLFSGSQI